MIPRNARVCVDFNNGVDRERVLLSREDAVLDSLGRQIQLHEVMAITVYEHDVDPEGKRDDLIAEGTVERNDTGMEAIAGWKWLCRIDFGTLRNASERRDIPE